MRIHFFIAAVIVLAACNAVDRRGTADSPAVCISDTSRHAGSAYLTTDEKNNPLINWCETDGAGNKFLYLSFFDTASGKFLPAISVPVVQHILFHEEGMPKMAVKGDGSLVAVYETSLPTNENDWAGSVDYMQSFDRGKTWTTPRAVHSDTAAGGSHSFAAITRLDNGEIGACWLGQSYDPRKGGRPVMFASTTGNSGFGKETLVDAVACECCRLAIAATGGGRVGIVYRDIINDSIRDISICTSSDNGQLFGTPVSFSQDQWKIAGCPHNGPDLVTTANATYAVWFTGGASKGVYYSELNNRQATVSRRLVAAEGRNIQLSLLPNGARVIAYSETIREGDSLYKSIRLQKIRDGKTFTKEVTLPAAHASYPVIKAFSNDRIVVAWTENQRVYYKTLREADINQVLPAADSAIENKRPVSTLHLLSMNIDPVCGMRIDNSIEDTTMAGSKVVGFCSKYCKEQFLGNPRKYMTRLNQ